MQLLVTTLLVVSAFASKKVDTKHSDKKHAKRGVFGLGYGGHGGYGGYGGYSGLGYSGFSGHGYSSLGYTGLGHDGYIQSAPIATAHYVQPHTHTHSVETKFIAQVLCKKNVFIIRLYNWIVFLINLALSCRQNSCSTTSMAPQNYFRFLFSSNFFDILALSRRKDSNR